MHLTRRGMPLAGLLILGLLAWARPAAATNGMFANGYGGGSKAMGGTGVTLSTDVLSAAQNPALGVTEGNIASLCVDQFMPQRNVDIANNGGPLPPGKFDSKNNWFPIVCGGVNTLVAPDWSVGLMAFANGGMNTHYDAPLFANFGPGATSPLGIDMGQEFIALNIAHEVNDRLSIGVAPTLAIQRFLAQGLQPFAPMSWAPNSVTNNGYDYSVGGGVKFGATYAVNNYLTIGAAYQSKMYMTPFDKYKGLFAGSGTLNIPAWVSDGIDIKPTRNVDLLLEHERIFYGDVKAISASGVPPFGPLGSPNGPGFGWKDMDVFRVGAQWWATHDLALRAGFSKATSFTTSSQALFNILAPATPTTHASTGFTYRLNDSYSLCFAYVHAFSHTFSGSTPGMMGNQVAALTMSQDEVMTGISYKW